MTSDLLEDPDGAPYPEEVQEFVRKHLPPATVISEKYEEEVREALVAALQATIRGWVDWAGDDLTERGRQLASEREDLIASGVDPAALTVPLAPRSPRKAGAIAAAEERGAAATIAVLGRHGILLQEDEDIVGFPNRVSKAVFRSAWAATLFLLPGPT